MVLAVLYLFLYKIFFKFFLSILMPYIKLNTAILHKHYQKEKLYQRAFIIFLYTQQTIISQYTSKTHLRIVTSYHIMTRLLLHYDVTKLTCIQPRWGRSSLPSTGRSSFPRLPVCTCTDPDRRTLDSLNLARVKTRLVCV